jgi:hypothetical protein
MSVDDGILTSEAEEFAFRDIDDHPGQAYDLDEVEEIDEDDDLVGH